MCRNFSIPTNPLVISSSNKAYKKKGAPRTAVLSILEDDNEQTYDYAVLVIGATGVGKSTLCNFFFGEEKFHSAGGMIRATSTCNSHCHSISGKNTMFIDSPGFSDTITDNKKRMEEMGKALLLARNGVHAVVICLNGAARFDEADAGLINEFKKLEIDEPQSIWAYTLVVFTHGQGMGRTEAQRNEVVNAWKSHPDCPPLLKELLDKTQNRFMVTESLKEDTSYYTQKCDEFMRYVEQIHANNNTTCYTHRLFTWARDKYEEAAKKQREMLDEQQDVVTKQVGLLQKNADLIAQLEKEKAEQVDKMQTIQEELHKAEVQLNDREHTISEYEEKIKAIQKNETLKIQDSLHKLNQAKEEAKISKEMVDKKQNECTEKTKEIQKIQEELEKKQQGMNELHQLLRDRQIKGEAETLAEALKLMIQDMVEMQERLVAKESKVTELTLKVGKYSAFGIPIPLSNRMIVTGPRANNKKTSKQKEDTPQLQQEDSFQVSIKNDETEN